jgi:hypothetical protein
VVASTAAADDARLEALGYKPQLNRVLGFFPNFAVAFTYLSPMVDIYSRSERPSQDQPLALQAGKS